VIRITSSEPVREPFLTLLVEANWSGGRLLREYGVLLDPEVLAPARSIARTAPPAAGTAGTAATAAAPAPAAAPVAAPRESTPAQMAAVPESPAPAPLPVAPGRPAQT